MDQQTRSAPSVTRLALRTFARALIFAFCLSGLGFAMFAAQSVSNVVVR
jgi:hypothetical protein